MNYTYKPKGTCSSKMDFVIDGDVIKSLKVTGGCNGNLQGIGALISGMTVDEVIAKLSGIHCGMKNTSCPDQIAQGLREYKLAAN